ncbi:hypothetical protein DFH08DRAFT_1045438 [Mycena albidolilacea]|uniref:Uncharacterized protein n=1 Tax=Mycena albidolilacea TaxID=1033008 RepID=A0AAD6Z8I2_9AGAR|nr:hypothetical protein DFH08DRAFT_1045438 [Mycena albidolilacea]
MASSSCTETTTYALEKYSRAYASKKPTGSSEWQHFTNPVLRLILDSKLSPESANSSLRMRIVWTMEGNQDVILEDLDLLAFSSLKDSSFKDKSDSSPLKGVYRDTTFGLRYLHVPESTDSQKVYRRFQVSFTSSSVALQLVNAIRDVCPCKTNDANLNVKNRKNTTHPGIASRAPPQRQDTVMVPNIAPGSHHASSLANTQIQLQHMPAMKPPHAPFVPPVLASLQPSARANSQPLEGLSSSPVVPGPSPYQSVYDHPMPNVPMLTGCGLPAQHPSKPSPSSLSSFPDSSPPSSTANSTMMPPPPPPLALQVSNGAGADADSLALTAALRDATGLYDLSHMALAKLVGDVVREDGFVRLLENMSSMWAMKALVEP